MFHGRNGYPMRDNLAISGQLLVSCIWPLFIDMYFYQQAHRLCAIRIRAFLFCLFLPVLAYPAARKRMCISGLGDEGAVDPRCCYYYLCQFFLLSLPILIWVALLGNVGGSFRHAANQLEDGLSLLLSWAYLTSRTSMSIGI